LLFQPVNHLTEGLKKNETIGASRLLLHQTILSRVLMKIENDKLTSDMELTRSGSTMLFRKDYDDRQFTNDQNADVVIKAPRPELTAKLINGGWHWVNDCPECNGKEPQWAYLKCEKHNVCVTCGISRKDTQGTIWGHRNGFRCDSCQTTINEQKRIEALARVAEKEYDEWDYIYKDDMLCPHCGMKQHHEMSDGEPPAEEICETCGGKFSIEVEYSWTYSTAVVGERITLNSQKAS
jgi:hypothetical protein